MASPKDYPIFRFRISDEQYNWLRDYSKRIGVPMSAIIKEYLDQLKRKDERAQRSAQREAES